MIKIKIHAQSGEDLRNQLLALLGDGQTTSTAHSLKVHIPEPAAETTVTKKKTQAPKVDAPAPEVKETPAAEETQQEQNSGEADYSKLKDDEVLEIMLAANNRAGVSAILNDMGYKKRTEVPAEKLHEFVKKVKELKPAE